MLDKSNIKVEGRYWNRCNERLVPDVQAQGGFGLGFVTGPCRTSSQFSLLRHLRHQRAQPRRASSSFGLLSPSNLISFPLLSGRGTISEVDRCGFFMDSSKRHGNKCIKVVLENDIPRAVLYYPESRQSELSELEVGQALNFNGCAIVELRDLGFWTTVTCDMP